MKTTPRILTTSMALSSAFRRWRAPLALCAMALCYGLPAPAAKAEITSASGATMINSLPTTISASGTYYLTSDFTFTSSSSNAITVNASNVTIDMNGHTITNTSGDANTSAGVAITDRGNVTVRNGNLVTFQVGVYVSSSTAQASYSNVCENLNVTHAYDSGLILYGTGCRAIHCRITLTGGSTNGPVVSFNGAGVHLGVGNGNIVESCEIDGTSPTTSPATGGGTTTSPTSLFGILNDGGANYALNNRITDMTYLAIAAPYGSLKVRGTLSSPSGTYDITDSGSND